jgi:uncharacterized protein YndB with AHSA1/START domain
MAATAAKAPAEKPKLTLVREFAAPPEAVWHAWTEPEALKRWFGPDAGAVSLAQTDVRVGGRFHVVFNTLDGETHDVSGAYREVVPNRKLVFTWSWISTPERISQVTLLFNPTKKGTELTLLHEQFFDMAARDGHERGWSGSMEKLARYLEQSPK